MDKIFQTECFSYDSDTAVAQFAAARYRAEFKDGTYPPMLMIAPAAFDGNTIDDFTKSQMWDCGDDKDAILSECRYALIGTDMLAAALPASERAALDMDFTEALVELFPECTAVYFENSGKLFTAETIRNHTLPRENRFIQFAVNVRFFTIQSSVYCPAPVFQINNGLSSPHENIVFCNRSNPGVFNTYCDSMRPFFTSTAISQAAAINS